VQFFDIHGGELDIVLLGKIDDGFQPHAAIKVHMQVSLGQPADEFSGHFDLHILILFILSRQIKQKPQNVN